MTNRAKVVFGGVGLFGILTIAGLVTLGSNLTPTSSAAYSYRVSGEVPKHVERARPDSDPGPTPVHWASVTYVNATGGTEMEKNVQLPWTYDLGPAKTGQAFYISVQNGGCVGCRNDDTTGVAEILANGASVKKSESSGQYAIATASGRF
jgi:hypothetical protein